MRRINNRAYAEFKGSIYAPDLRGYVYFGFHIHEYGICEITDPMDPFSSAGGHYNPTDQPHGNHAGDLPVLFSNDGYARMSVFTSKFKPRDIIGRSIIIHQNPDDYRSQPAGNAGKRIGCGLIKAV